MTRQVMIGVAVVGISAVVAPVVVGTLFIGFTVAALLTEKRSKEYNDKVIDINVAHATIDDRKQKLSETHIKSQNKWIPREVYVSYLSTSVWRTKRAKVLDRDGYACCDCGSDVSGKAEAEVHHIHYENLMNEPLDDLVTLCVSCHKSRHQKQREAEAKSTKMDWLKW